MIAKQFKGRRKIRLATPRDVRIEMRKIYGAAVKGELEWQEATRAAYVLRIIADADMNSGAVDRLATLEAKLAAIRPPNGHAPEVRPS